MSANEDMCDCRSGEVSGEEPPDPIGDDGGKFRERLLELYCAYEYGIRRANGKIKRLKLQNKLLAERVMLLEADDGVRRVPRERLEEAERAYKKNLRSVIKQQFRNEETTSARHRQFYKSVLDATDRLIFEKDSENSELRKILSERYSGERPSEDRGVAEKCAKAVGESEAVESDVVKSKDATKREVAKERGDVKRAAAVESDVDKSKDSNERREKLHRNDVSFDLTTVKKIELTGLNVELVRRDFETVLSVSGEAPSLDVLRDLKDLKETYRKIALRLNIPEEK